MNLILRTLVTLAVLAHGAANATTFDRFDKNHSTISFKVPIMGGLSSVEGKFTEFDITVEYDPAEPTQSSVIAVVKVASVETGIDDRDHHLMSPEFFHVAEYPELRFESSSVQENDGGVVAHGQLTMRGVTTSVSLPFKFTGYIENAETKSLLLGVKTATSLDRQDYGISWRHDTPLFVGDEIEVEIQLISRLTQP